MRTAIVIGASMAGMLTARVLAETFETVVILEKDELPQIPGPRAGCRRRGTFTRFCLVGCTFWRNSFQGLWPSWLRSAPRCWTWASCAFNPVYGQGMTTAALAAENLREHLKHLPEALMD